MTGVNEAALSVSEHINWQALAVMLFLKTLKKFA
jgi:hypothetical protein